jgi:four helix bundle protein
MQNFNSKPKTDLKQRCFEFSLKVIRLTDDLPNKRSAWIIADQLIRAACSIGANLVEARGSSSRLEFKKYCEISLKSANETQYWLALLRDTKISSAAFVDPLLKEAEELTKMLAAGVIKLKSRQF